ncbi:MAG: hypothetical protein P8M07_01870 [Flavobacteriales bacterium]|nr:hypothetical protein [Flavobacteriales bacterium]
MQQFYAPSPSVRMPKPSLFSTLFSTAIAATCCLASCGPNSRWDVDISHSEHSTAFHRPFEQVISAAQSGSFAAPSEAHRSAQEQAIQQEFWTTYCEDVLRLGAWPATTPPSDSLQSAFVEFAQNEITQRAVSGIDSLVRPQLKAAEDELASAFRRFSVHFPESRTPEVFWMYSGFNYAVVPQDELLAVGLEFFLGPKHPSVAGLPRSIYPRYAQKRMVIEHLASDALRGWLLVHFQDEHLPKLPSTTAAIILYWGKVLYVAQAIAPEIPIERLLNLSSEEYAWAQRHELAVWLELRKDDVLYSKSRQDANRWVRDAPFTNAGALPQDSPDRLGWYMGLRWAEDYMARHSGASLQDLLEQEDVLTFLQSYRPLQP